MGAIIIGPRLGKFSKGKVNYFAPSNYNFIVFGVFILVFAWFGFNAGSLLKFDESVSLILLNTLIGASFGGIAGWVLSLFSRENDILARWGGEEFVVIVYTKDINIAQNVAEKLRVAIEKFHFTTVNKLTSSFGVSLVKNKKDTFENIFENADKALYQAKEIGRNRVCTW
jgi:hypothetical protein